MQDSRNVLTIEDIVFKKHLKERNCLWLPVPLPAVNDIPSDVALWLFELRHLSDTNDVSIPDNVKDCDAQIHEIWTCEDGDISKILRDATCQESSGFADDAASQSHTGSKLLSDKEINECKNYEEIVNTQPVINAKKSKQNYDNHNEDSVNTPSKLHNEESKDINEEGTLSTLGIENLKETHHQHNNSDSKLKLSAENLNQEEYHINDVTDHKELTNKSKENCQQNENSVKTVEKLNVENSYQDNAQQDKDTVVKRKSRNDSQEKEEPANTTTSVNPGNSEDKKTKSEKITRPHSYGGGELATYIQTRRSVACILWEANPLYGAVGDKVKEGSGRGFRKLCHSSVEELGNSLSHGPSEHTSESAFMNYKPLIVQDDKVSHFICSNTVNSTSNKFESEQNPMYQEESIDASTNIEDNSNHIDSELVCVRNRDVNILQSQHQSAKIESNETTDICDRTVENLKYGDSDSENVGTFFMSTNGSTNKETARMSYDEQCEEVLNALERVIQSLEVEDEESQDYAIEPDSDFLELCKEADDLAEESIQQCPLIVPVNPKVTVTRSITMSSDLSDDVFVNSPSKEDGPILYPTVTEVRRHHSLDINTIFDDGTKPPVPPARKKRSKDKDRYKTVPQMNTSSSSISSHTVTKSSSEQENNDVKEIVDVTIVQDKDSMQEVTSDCNFLNFENQPQELAIIKRVTDMTKEKRNAKVASQYEDANFCCEQCQAGECNLSTCSQSANFATIPNPTSSTPKVSVSEESTEVPGINMTPLRPIFTVEFPPSENMCRDKRHSAIPILTNESVISCDDSGISLPNDSVLRSRKGSTSSDIEAWKQELQLSGLCYLDEELDVNCMFQEEEWFSSNDSEGRIYFFEENSNESSWTLPEVRVTSCDSPASTKLISKETKMGAKKPTKEEKQLEGDVQLRSDQLGNEPEIKSQYRMAKAHSMALLESSSGKQASSKSSSFPRNWPQLWDGNMTVLKEGTLNRTKITENGKKLRKNWAPSHVVLTELFLLFFKDAKTFSAMKNAQGESSSAARPEISVDLNGALLEHGEKASSRRNVFLVSTFLGLQVLVQCDSGPQAEEWYQAIQKAITDLPSAYDSCPRNKAPKLSPTPYLGSHSPEEFKKSSRIGRSRSVKLKLSAKEVGSQEDLTVSPDENQTKIKNRLKKFFHRRPTKESLVKKGIYKDEPVFGCHLADVCKGESPKVPAFVQRCIAAIECKEENMKTDGLYRASGNLSQVQKIRLQVDQNNLAILESEEDVHVLTGTLKLFFRELKKPLIPFEYFNKALKASTNQNKKEKLQQFRDIVKALPHPNRDTLEYLLRHLLRVTKYQDSNRMHIPNLAIVFGPTLMWPEAESANMALDLMQQNLVIECFLQEFESIFR